MYLSDTYDTFCSSGAYTREVFSFRGSKFKPLPKIARKLLNVFKERQNLRTI